MAITKIARRSTAMRRRARPRWWLSPRVGDRSSAVQADDRGGSNQHSALLERQDYTVVACYRSIYAPRTGGAYDSHHRTEGIAGCTRRRGCRVAARGARAAAGEGADHRLPRLGPPPNGRALPPP